MNLHVVNAGSFKLDGGAMYGVVPKTLWKSLNPPDENNLCTWATRCLLVEDGERKILIDTGIGDKQDDKFKSHFQPQEGISLLSSLESVGVGPDEVTDVILTHLHFDHCGGAISKVNGELKPTFSNATYWSNEKHWKWAVEPNPREAASFLTENILPIKQSGQLEFIKEGASPFANIELEWVSGHTTAMMIPYIHHPQKTIAYTADLIPSAGHVKIPYVMAYDMQPLLTLQEKEVFLKKALDNDYVLFFEHDLMNECATLFKKNDRILVEEVMSLEMTITT